MGTPVQASPAQASDVETEDVDHRAEQHDSDDAGTEEEFAYDEKYADAAADTTDEEGDGDEAAVAEGAESGNAAADEEGLAVYDDTVLQALLSLNVLATRTMSLDTALLRGCADVAAFSTRVRELAARQAQPPNAAAVDRLITLLLPLVRQINKLPAEPGDVALPAAPAARLPAATPTAPAPEAAAPGAATGADPHAAMRAKLQGLRVKLLRVAKRMGTDERNNVVAQVLYRLELAEQLKAPGAPPPRPGGAQGTALQRAQAEAAEAEAAAGADTPLESECTILLLGKSGVGKSSTVNSLVGGTAKTVPTSAFEEGPETVTAVDITVSGIKLRVIDTPGLHPGAAAAPRNAAVLARIKAATRSKAPDIVLYFDRLDTPARDTLLGDLPLLKAITDAFGPQMWFNSIVVLTHGASAPPDSVSSYDMYVAQRSHLLQQAVRQAAGDMRLMNPVALAENHAACRTNRAGERVLPNGRLWKSELLVLCFSSKILAEANALLNLQEGGGRGGPAAARGKMPPLPFLLSQLVASRKPREAPQPEMGEDGLPLDEPPPPPPDSGSGPLPRQSTVHLPAPEPALPPSFDSDAALLHFKYVEEPGAWAMRPQIEANSWDHEPGIDAFSMERSFQLFKRHPAGIQAQVQKNKKDASLSAEAEASFKHLDSLVTTTGLDLTTVGKQLVYTLRGETRWANRKNNKTGLGATAALMGGTVAYGSKIEDRLRLGPVKLVGTVAAMTAKKEVAWAGNVEGVWRKGEGGDAARVSVSSSFMNWRGDLALGFNATSQFNVKVGGAPVGVTGRFNLNSRGAGQIALRLASNERLEIAAFMLVPIACALISKLRGGGEEEEEEEEDEEDPAGAAA